jgi:hypothetical protein
MAKTKLTIAERWIKRLDDNSSPAVTAKMQDKDVVGVVEEFGTYVYIFKDGSAVYEKRRGDWYPAGEYVQCSECEEWREAEEFDALDDKCATCIQEDEDNEAATAILKSAILN